jgi:RNA polymerase sigma-70 factor (ECF subfamily)
MSAELPRSSGDERARALYLEHGPAIENWAHGRFGDRQAAEEVVQEVVLAAWQKYGQFDPSRGSERAWVFGIARNVAATRYRRGRRHLASVPTAETPDRGADDVELGRLVDRSLIADSVRALSSEHRAVLVAAYWDRLSTHEISERLHIPEGTVKSRLFYALRILRAGLDEREVL